MYPIKYIDGIDRTPFMDEDAEIESGSDELFAEWNAPSQEKRHGYPAVPAPVPIATNRARRGSRWVQNREALT